MIADAPASAIAVGCPVGLLPPAKATIARQKNFPDFGVQPSRLPIAAMSASSISSGCAAAVGGGAPSGGFTYEVTHAEDDSSIATTNGSFIDDGTRGILFMQCLQWGVSGGWTTCGASRVA